MTPAERVRCELRAARAAGVPFDAAWTAAVAAALPPFERHDHSERVAALH